MARSGLKTVHLNLPASTADLRKLEIGSVAYLTGRVFTAREGVYKHAIEDGAGMPASRDTLGLANFHCSPAASINADGSHTVGAVTATASFRFARWLDGWLKLSGCNITVVRRGRHYADWSQRRSHPAQPAPPAQFFKGNLHTHTLNSDGDSTPDDVVRWYREHNYNFVTITDHNYLTERRWSQRAARRRRQVPRDEG